MCNVYQFSLVYAILSIYYYLLLIIIAHKDYSSKEGFSVTSNEQLFLEKILFQMYETFI